MNNTDYEKAILAEIDWCMSAEIPGSDNPKEFRRGFIDGLKDAVFIIRSIKNSTLTLKTCNQCGGDVGNNILQLCDKCLLKGQKFIKVIENKGVTNGN